MYLKLLVIVSLILNAFCYAKVNNTDTPYTYDLAIGAIFHDEAPYLKEWIEFHKLVGVQHFYLYNNLSADDYYAVLEPYIKRGEVDLVNWPEVTKAFNVDFQVPAYNDLIPKVRGKVKWLAIVDIDEFLFPVKQDSLIEFLKDYEEFGGVGANWVLFGTSNVYKIPSNGLITEYLILRADYNYRPNRQAKSIIRPERVQSIKNAHCAHYYFPYFCVSSNKEKFDGIESPSLAIDKVRINHYWTRDKHYFHTKKIPRRISNGYSYQFCLNLANSINQIEDKHIQRFLPKLKAAMGK